MSGAGGNLNRHARRAMQAKGTQTVIFRRATGWYPLELPLNEDLSKHAELNPGTLRIEDIEGRVLWQPQ